MKAAGFIAFSGLVVLASPSLAIDELTQSQARARAVAILKGNPYGRTAAEVSGNIKGTAFLADGNTRACGAKGRPVWEFHVMAVTPNKSQFNNGVINGFLALDARTGKLLCANLPMLD